jgi:3-oxoacyl-[acyl-carrier-protein] synthase-3
LSVQAGRECLEESEINKKDIDLLIFASASQDITEPATANIVQK